MELTGYCFALTIPASWKIETRNGIPVAASNESFAGFTPNVVLRESQITHPAATALAAASQANLTALPTHIPGAFFFHIEALPDPNATPGPAERRRSWAFSTLNIPAAHGNALCILTIQDLLVVDNVIAEATTTVPLMAWNPGSVYETILDTLHPLPATTRRTPHTTSEVNTPDLDTWASTRDGVPREKLNLQPPPTPALTGEIATLSQRAFTALDDLALLGRSTKASKFSAAGQELRATGIINNPGTLTDTGEWIATHLRQGRHFAITVSSSPPQLLTFWINDMTVLVLSHTTDAATGEPTHRLFHCLVDDVPRFVFMWLGLQPSWDMTFEYVFSQAELAAKLLGGAPPVAVPGGDAMEFTRQRWIAASLIGPDDEDAPSLAWAMTQNRGVALLAQAGYEDKATVYRESSEPFWLLLTGILLKLAEGDAS